MKYANGIENLENGMQIKAWTYCSGIAFQAKNRSRLKNFK